MPARAAGRLPVPFQNHTDTFVKPLDASPVASDWASVYPDQGAELPNVYDCPLVQLVTGVPTGVELVADEGARRKYAPTPRSATPPTERAMTMFEIGFSRVLRLIG
jgi:hypothetical protein